MTKPVRVSPVAALHMLEIDAWWREHREKAPDLFEQELAVWGGIRGAGPDLSTL